MAAEAQVRRLVVTHRYPLGTDAEVLSQIRQSYGGPVSFAVDLDAHVL
jgi:ribonuclease BN (tRNA processing enzyme)